MSERSGKKKSKEKKVHRQQAVLKWDKLDNTANLFPVIVSETVSNVYRISVTLKEQIEPELLQRALDKVLPYFDVFKCRLRKGFFWYYFEQNKRPSPRVMPENIYPCAYINPYSNNGYLFRVTYYEKRINLEVFHVLTDGNGALTFLKELTYQYLRFRYPELKQDGVNPLHEDTSLNKEDSYVRNYRKSAKKEYKTEKAVILNGEKLPFTHFGIMHGYISVQDIKRVAKGYGVTINQYLVGTFIWSVYKAYLNETASDRPISACVPVNLRPYFNSDTIKNFFVIVSAYFKPERDNYTFEEVLRIVADGLKEQINKENLEKLFSYNVSNEKNLVIRAVPLFVKNIAMKSVYKKSARANTTTITNLGMITVVDEYRDYIDRFHVVLSMSKGQHIKGGVCSYGDTLVFTFSAAIKDTAVQKEFFRHMTGEGIHVAVETNGVYYE
jgi:NRPS condensation-like uncharacterized protein